MKDVTAVVLHWNGLEATCRCLEALAAAAPETPVLLVDNGSDDDSAAALATLRGPTVLSLPTNGGYGAGMNAGARAATTPYVLLLNNDAEVGAGMLAALRAALDADPRAAAAAPTIYHGRSPSRARCWYAGGSLGRWTAVTRHDPQPPVDARRPADAARPADAPRAVGFASGCCLLVRAEAFAAGFDERYFLYFEDADLCRRWSAAGRPILHVPAAEAWHDAGASTGSRAAKAPALDYYDLRNGIRFLRGQPAPQRLSAWAYLLAVRLPRKLARILVSPPRGPALAAVVRGLVDGWRGRTGPMR